MTVVPTPLRGVSMSQTLTTDSRARVDGKFFRLGEWKFYLKGVAYGPFAPRDGGECFPEAGQVARDFVQVTELGANLVQLYTTPSRWLLDLAAEHGLRLLLDIPWPKNRCFLDSERTREEAREAVRGMVRACVGHPAVFAY